jgi:hypothetical protein
VKGRRREISRCFRDWRKVVSEVGGLAKFECSTIGCSGRPPSCERYFVLQQAPKGIMKFGNIIFLHAIEMLCDLKIQHLGLDLHFMIGFFMVEPYHNPPRLRKPHTSSTPLRCATTLYTVRHSILRSFVPTPRDHHRPSNDPSKALIHNSKTRPRPDLPLYITHEYPNHLHGLLPTIWLRRSRSRSRPPWHPPKNTLPSRMPQPHPSPLSPSSTYSRLLGLSTLPVALLRIGNGVLWAWLIPQMIAL